MRFLMDFQEIESKYGHLVDGWLINRSGIVREHELIWELRYFVSAKKKEIEIWGFCGAKKAQTVFWGTLRRSKKKSIWGLNGNLKRGPSKPVRCVGLRLMQLRKAEGELTLQENGLTSRNCKDWIDQETFPRLALSPGPTESILDCSSFLMTLDNLARWGMSDRWGTNPYNLRDFCTDSFWL